MNRFPVYTWGLLSGLWYDFYALLRVDENIIWVFPFSF